MLDNFISALMMDGKNILSGLGHGSDDTGAMISGQKPLGFGSNGKELFGPPAPGEAAGGLLSGIDFSLAAPILKGLLNGPKGNTAQAPSVRAPDASFHGNIQKLNLPQTNPASIATRLKGQLR